MVPLVGDEELGVLSLLGSKLEYLRIGREVDDMLGEILLVVLQESPFRC